MAFRAGIVGHRGYSGMELVRLLGDHPYVEPVLLDHREDPGGAPRLKKPVEAARAKCTPEAVVSEKLDFVFLATPPEVSMDLAPAMLRAGARVVDLSGAFRLGTPERYQTWYGAKHSQPVLLKEAVYGLPEISRVGIREARLLSNPGCYPTAANLSIQPLISAGVIDRTCGIVCDAKSGVSGAGRKPTLKTSFCEVTENFSAYAILGHRHVPEILMVSEISEAEFSFTAQLLPLRRGILETIYFRSQALRSVEDLFAVYEKRYSAEKFIRIYETNCYPDLAAVQRTNFCDIGCAFDPASGRGVVVSAIDNLVKGAAGQAIQNMNLMLGLDEDLGLIKACLSGGDLISARSQARS